ncbi:MAG: IPT/TIG domain-containing protein, partial [Myxococcota bacterium]|nr:IPT/TIG domain-containing protein [Myxococcota bacterium]
MTTVRQRLGPLLLPLALATGLMGCPDLPRSPPEDLDASVSTDGLDDDADGEAVTPLSLDRVVESRSATGESIRVTIHGAGFTEGASVEFGGLEASGVLTLDEEQINCDVPEHEAGLVDVAVTLPDGQRAVIRDGFLFQSALDLTSVEPIIDLCRGGAPVTIRGQGFTEETIALIG